MSRVAIALIAAACSFGLVHADENAGASSCARIADRESRLNCYDALFGAPSTGARVRIPVQTAPAAAQGAAPAEEFGGDFRKRMLAANNAVTKQLDAVVKSVEHLPHSRSSLTFESGQIWVTSEDDSAIEFKAGDQVIISRTLLGGYRVFRHGSNRNVLIARVY